MSKSKSDGGPAFPVLAYDHSIAGDIRPQPTIYDGMTLRDYFAAAALPALVTSALALDHVKWDATAEHAYLIADAMIRERAQ